MFDFYLVLPHMHLFGNDILISGASAIVMKCIM